MQVKHEKVVFDKPIYVGSPILDLGKTLMYNFHYQFACKNFVKDDKKPELCLMNTNSFIYDIPMSTTERDIIAIPSGM